MSKDTSYIIQTVGDEVQDIDTRSRKDAAVSLADNYHTDHPDEKVQVVTDAGTVVYSVVETEPETESTEVEALVEAGASDEVIAEAVKRAKPWSRTEEAKFPVPTREGYTLAYTRTRTKTAIYRSHDKSGWLILDTRTGEEWTTENTEKGREITNRLQKEYLAQVKADRAAAKVAKDEARAAAKAAKAEADAAAKAEKDAAKAEKLAAKEAAAAAAEAEVEDGEKVDA